MNEDEQRAYDEGVRDGYMLGEAERVALATANQNLRSELAVLLGRQVA